jgi:hypothetical protein
MPKPGVVHQYNTAAYYGKALLCHCTYIWCLRQWHPGHDLLLYKYNTSAAFQRIMYHPNIVPTFATVLQNMICIPVRLILKAAPPLFLL